ncbi:hypothetical protein M1P56_35735 (plasmid) [Streptomyces sp. HU2014]|uniref:hypothetical protein n=1 Tax=Streptomyces sp. HU2014 TaxID=2939414 RepID=UPI00200DC614|nr:hypothetical protein [Streptomyces sp. HU2014]UQI49843.1 hypothetical protein M1P56_35735 [Streptomyces sp. HU2014]
MTTILKPLASYGPRQFGDRIGFSEWQFERALRLDLIPRADQGGRWSATAFNEVVSRLDAVRTAVGTLPDLGAARTEEHLAERFGITVNPGTAAELSRRGHLPARGDSLLSLRVDAARTSGEARWVGGFTGYLSGVRYQWSGCPYSRALKT